MKKITLITKIKFSPTAKASVDNPYINTVDFILTDDKPNKNGTGIKREEFIGFANSAVFMPLKMPLGGIGEDHTGATPIGAIIETVVGEHTVSGTGVVWPQERPSDISFLKERISEADAFISWELAYTDMEEDDEGGVYWIKNPRCLAATLVKTPAYQERTPMFGFSSTENEDNMPEEINTDQAPPEEAPLEEAPPEEAPPEEAPPEETPPEKAPPEEVPPKEEPLGDLETKYNKLITELDALRQFKLLTERGQVVRDSLGDLAKEDVNILVALTDEQLGVVKRLVAAKNRTATSSTSRIPNFTTPHEQDDVSILKQFLKGEN